MFKKIIYLTLLFLAIVWIPHSTAFAAPPDELDVHETFVRGKILKVVSQKQVKVSQSTFLEEKLSVQILEGQEKNKIVTIETSGDPQQKTNKLTEGESVVVDSKPDPSGKMQYSIYEPYRLNMLIFIFLGFLLLIIFIAGRKGVGALIGLILSLLIITLWIIPQIIQGQDPLQICILGACTILIITTYIAHGFSLKTTVAILGTSIALAFAGWLAVTVVQLLQTTGLGNEDIYTLQVGSSHPINAQGLLLGGIIIGTLGALNDITTTQAMTIFTLIKENPKQKFSELFQKGMVIGKEHIASLINTLVLAYAGSSLAVFIFFALNPAQLPWWVILNNETTIEEIIKAIVGSSTLILAVPITTALAAWVAHRGLTFLDFIYPLLKELNLVTEKKK
jgi:uncharacterized membrane protein